MAFGGSAQAECLCPYSVPVPPGGMATPWPGHCSGQPDQLDTHTSLLPSLAEQHPTAPKPHQNLATRGSHTALHTSLELYKRKFANNEGRDTSPSITTTELKAQLKTSLKSALNPNILGRHQAELGAQSRRLGGGRSRTGTGPGNRTMDTEQTHGQGRIHGHRTAPWTQSSLLGHRHALIPPEQHSAFKAFIANSPLKPELPGNKDSLCA